MKPRHHFASKKEERLSLVWLDENFQQALDKCTELETRLNEQGQKLKAREDENLSLRDALAKVGTINSIADRVIAKLKEKKK